MWRSNAPAVCREIPTRRLRIKTCERGSTCLNASSAFFNLSLSSSFLSHLQTRRRSPARASLTKSSPLRVSRTGHVNRASHKGGREKPQVEAVEETWTHGRSPQKNQRERKCVSHRDSLDSGYQQPTVSSRARALSPYTHRKMCQLSEDARQRLSHLQLGPHDFRKETQSQQPPFSVGDRAGEKRDRPVCPYTCSADGGYKINGIPNWCSSNLSGSLSKFNII